VVPPNTTTDKTRLDKFWTFQDVKYDYTVDLTGTGDRSEFDTENY